MPGLTQAEIRAGFLGLTALASSAIVLDVDLSVGTSAFGAGVGRDALILLSNDAAGSQSATNQRLDIDLDVEAKSGVTGVAPRTLHYRDDDLFVADAPDEFDRADFEAGSEIADFYKTDSGSVLSLLDQFGAFLASFDTVALGLPIPLTQGQTLGDRCRVQKLLGRGEGRQTQIGTQQSFLRYPYGRRLLSKDESIKFKLKAKPGAKDVIVLNVTAYTGDMSEDNADGSRFIRRRLELKLKPGATAKGKRSKKSDWGRTVFRPAE